MLKDIFFLLYSIGNHRKLFKYNDFIDMTPRTRVDLIGLFSIAGYCYCFGNILRILQDCCNLR